jgi:hypothetical protein
MMTNASPLAGKTALVTGAARRLGRAVALALAREGVHIMAHYHQSRDEAEALALELRTTGVRVGTLSADLRDPEAAEELLPRAIEAAGEIDFLVNNASIFPPGFLAHIDHNDLMENIAVNAWAPFVLSRALAARERPARIVNLLDCRIVDFDHTHAAYHLSKRMLFTLTRMTALEFAPAVTVNAVAPGLVLPPEGESTDYLERYADTNPLRRWGSPDDVAEAVLFLLRVEFITGQVIFVDGGRHLRGSVYGL